MPRAGSSPATAGCWRRRRSGLAEVPTIELPHLSEAQKRALRIADNKIALGAGWDLELLKLELGELAVLDVDLDLALTGFSSGEIDVILKGPADPEDEVIPAVPASPRPGPATSGSSASTASAAATAATSAFLQAVVGDGAAIDAAFLDPPYNVRINGHANAKGRHREFAMASGEMSEAAFRTFLVRDARRLRRRCRATARCTSSAWTGGTSRTSRRSAVRSTASSSTSASGTSPTPAWARSTARSTSWSSSTGSARRRTSTPSSSAGTAATAPTSGTMPR